MIASFLAIPIHAETLNASDVYYVTDNANVLSQSTVEKIKNFNGALEQQCCQAGTAEGPLLRPKLLDDWLCIPGHAPPYSAARPLGCSAQASESAGNESLLHV